jgi:hypothetical protein
MKYRSFVVVNDLINFGKYGINVMLLWHIWFVDAPQEKFNGIPIN